MNNEEEKVNKEKVTVYEDVTLKIREIIKEDLFYGGFGEEKQKEVIQVLEDNFNIGDQAMGKIFLENKIMFNKDTGEYLEITVPFFMCPMFLVHGYRVLISNDCFPTFNIKNKYTGYWDGGKFRKAPSKVDRFLKDEKFTITFLVIAFIYIVALILIGFGTKKI